MILHLLHTHIDGALITKIIAYVGERTDIPVGTCDLKFSGRRCASIRQLFVHRAYRKQGIGRALIEKCIELAGANCKSLGLLVKRDNADAIAFYKKLGFIYAYEDPEDYIMALSLSNVQQVSRADLEASEVSDGDRVSKKSAVSGQKSDETDDDLGLSSALARARDRSEDSALPADISVLKIIPPTWPKRKGTRQEITNVLSRIRPILDDRDGYRVVLTDFITHLACLGRAFYSGNYKEVDEFLQLYCLDHARKDPLPVGEAASFPSAASVEAAVPAAENQGLMYSREQVSSLLTERQELLELVKSFKTSVDGCDNPSALLDASVSFSKQVFELLIGNDDKASHIWDGSGICMKCFKHSDDLPPGQPCSATVPKGMRDKIEDPITK